MAEKSEKFLSLDEFKERVYKNIGTLETWEEIESGKPFAAEEKGCLSFFMLPFIVNISLWANKKGRDYWKFDEIDKQADEILAREEVRNLLCEKLDATVVLPIDAAYKITPVLYALALEDEEKVPFDTKLFAVISRKIVKQGVENYCAAKPKKGKKATENKPEGDSK